RADGLDGGPRPAHRGKGCGGRAPDPAQGGDRSAEGQVSGAGDVRSDCQGAERSCRPTGEGRRPSVRGAERPLVSGAQARGEELVHCHLAGVVGNPGGARGWTTVRNDPAFCTEAARRVTPIGPCSRCVANPRRCQPTTSGYLRTRRGSAPSTG